MNNVQDFFRHSWSSGITDGGNITDNGNGTVNIAQSEGEFRTTDTSDLVLIPLVVPAITNLALTDNEVNYVFANYNSGSPVLQSSTSSTGLS